MQLNNQKSELHPAYRPDIDGLRAVAILSVLIFHAFPNALPGGFVGVDIFFIISGFLISSIIFKGAAKGTFSFVDFYARRIKRIYPALIFVLISCLLYGWLVLLEDEYRQLGKQVAGGVGFISNFVLLAEAGYFDAASELKPLLHLWSLGVEEQFYLIWPLAILLIYRFKWRPAFILALAILLSFGLNVYFIKQHPIDVFYHPSTRFWELFLGALLAYRSLNSATSNTLIPEALTKKFGLHAINNAKSWLGLGLIIIAIAVLNQTKSFPGYWAILPTMGAYLMISAGSHAWFNRHILASKAFVFIGLISFPLYLWHWPLLSFAHIMAFEKPSATTLLVCIALSFLLAWLTYAVIEKPVRKSSHFPLTFYLFTISMLIGVAGYAVYKAKIAPHSAQHIPPKIVSAMKEWEFPEHHLDGTWHYAGNILKPIVFEGKTFWQQGEGDKKVLFIGDSNVEQYFSRTQQLFKEKPSAIKPIVFATSGACIPVPNPGIDQLTWCDHFAQKAYKFAEKPDVETVVIGGSWVAYRHGNPEAPNSRAPAENIKGYMPNLRAELKKLARNHKKVYLILNIPADDKMSPKKLIKRSWLGDFTVEEQFLDKQAFEKSIADFQTELTEAAQETGATIINPADYLCDATNCPTISNGELMYLDSEHLLSSYIRNHVLYLDKILYKD